MIAFCSLWATRLVSYCRLRITEYIGGFVKRRLEWGSFELLSCRISVHFVSWYLISGSEHPQQQAGGKHGNAGMGMEIRLYTTKDVGQPFAWFRFQSCFQSHQRVVVKLSYVVLCYFSGENYLWLVTWIDYEI